MKIFASIILLFLISIGNLYSQTPLEKEVLNQLNIYRKQHGLNPVQIDTTISRIARYHAEYLAQCNKVKHVVHYDKLPHDEQFDIKGFIERDFDQRVAMAPEKNIWSEIQMQAMCAKVGVSNVVISKGIIEAFDSSPNHKEIMLCEDVARLVNVIGISVIQTVKNDNGYDEYVVNIDFGSLLIP